MRKISLIIFFSVIFSTFALLIGQGALAANVWGWAWTDTFGWISFNKTNTGSAIDYGVSIDNGTGLMSGYAWCEYYGWISFNQADLIDCPVAPCESRVNLTSYNVNGWARLIAPHEIRLEYQNDSISGGYGYGGLSMLAQGFKIGTKGPNINQKINRVVLSLSSGNQTQVSIREAAYNGYPEGGDLPGCSTVITGSGSTAYFPSCFLSAGREYSLIVGAPVAGGKIWNIHNASNIDYPGSYPFLNSFASSDNGLNWNNTSLIVHPDPAIGEWNSSDFYFEFYGEVADSWLKLNGPSYQVSINTDIYPNEFKGWGWSNKMGWTSFNRINCDPDSNGTSNGIGNCPPVGTAIADYKVMTDLVRINQDPVAAISCNPASCEVFQGDPLIFVNNSTDPDSTNPPANNNNITNSRWWTKKQSEPASSYILQNACVFCNYTPSLGLGGATNYMDYTVKLRVTDLAGAYSEAERVFRIKRALSVDFQCRLNPSDPWQRCDTVTPNTGDIIYLNDISVPSYGASVSSRTWNKDDSSGNFDFSVGSPGNPNPSISFIAPQADISLRVRDSAGKVATKTYTINGTMRLPIWKEVNPW